MNATTHNTEVAEVAELLAAGTEATLVVTLAAWNTIEVRNNPARQIDPKAKLDMLRLVWEDESYWTLFHNTHNGVNKGSAHFSNSMVGAMFATVTDFFETL